MRYLPFILTGILGIASGCNHDQESDAYGNFIATEILISTETAGKIVANLIEEGQTVDSGAIAYVIDTLQNFLKRNELIARKNSVQSKKPNLAAQIDILKEQRSALLQDLDRFQKMFEEGAVSQKQIDDLRNSINILDKQIDQVGTNYITIENEAVAMEASIAQVEDLMKRSVVRVPWQGTILETYAETGEAAIPGKFLFKLADLKTMELKAYFSGNQLSRIRIGQEVEVIVDNGDDDVRSLTGVVSWISPNAEFTPKIIQTREERVSQVYAVRIRVTNDGTIKINMPGEVRLAE